METKINGPICSAFVIGGYDEPHQVVLMEPGSLYTCRTPSGESIEKSVLLPQQSINALLNL